MSKKLKDLLDRAGWSFVQGFVTTFTILAPGLFSAPNLSEAKAAAIGVLGACIMGGLSAIKTAVLNYVKTKVTTL